MTATTVPNRPANHPLDPGPSPDPAQTGIASLGLALPSLALDVRTLAPLRGEDPDKYSLGLGCGEMALCAEGEDAVSLATAAARRAMDRWGGDAAEIGLVAVGTESAVDMSRPLSAWVADGLGLRGSVRSYEVKHACYGGTLALRQAVEWRSSGAARGRAALVVASDVALYGPEDPGEPTQGAGAVAMVVGAPEVARVDVETHAWSEPAFDFWRPVGEAYPRVDGKFSLDCYKLAAERCVGQWLGGRDGEAAREALGELAAMCFHVPFPKMVKKAVMHVGETLGWGPEETVAFFDAKVVPTLGWNRRTGNAYTASLWISVAEALRGLGPGERLGAFSYGSGFGSELLTLEAGPAAAAGAWGEDIEADLAARRLLTGDEYQRLRGLRKVA
ncbi:MAG: hydroxymethylglutaryl-CoA synthase [Acidobacteriota bacterium]